MLSSDWNLQRLPSVHTDRALEDAPHVHNDNAVELLVARTPRCSRTAVKASMAPSRSRPLNATFSSAKQISIANDQGTMLDADNNSTEITTARPEMTTDSAADGSDCMTLKFMNSKPLADQSMLIASMPTESEIESEQSEASGQVKKRRVMSAAELFPQTTHQDKEECWDESCFWGSKIDELVLSKMETGGWDGVDARAGQCREGCRESCWR